MLIAQYQTNTNEAFAMVEVQYEEVDELNEFVKDRFCIIWNVGDQANLFVDNQLISLKQNCILFLTEANTVEHTKFSSLRIIHFNSDFFCSNERHSDLGCQGLLFFGSSNVPKITLTEEMLSFCEWTWNWFFQELQVQEAYKLSALQSTLDLVVAMSTRAFKNQNIEFISNNFEVDIIKEYHYLVEKHYKKIITVKAYAKILNISAKSLSNIFKKYDNRAPSEIIKERRQIQAIRLLKNTSMPIGEITSELSFKDIQTFSRFFKRNTGLSPMQYRKKINEDL